MGEKRREIKSTREPNLGNNLILLLLVFGRTGVCCLRAEEMLEKKQQKDCVLKKIKKNICLKKDREKWKSKKRRV